ncbi:MAG: cytochrome c-type biogenesis protein CcmH [Ktedonobacteraceae bacterium]|nr:cytochrome c-type biogenesis protein CcmH [Ktedonobacteraceae bacterium]
MKKRPLILLLSAIVLVSAIWLALWLFHASTQTLDDHVQAVAQQLKCPVCQGESVADSPALLSQQMRATIRQQIQQGRSDQQIIQYFEDRYGPQVVWVPQFRGFALLAWLVPLALLVLGALFLFLTLRDWRTAAPSPSGDASADDHDSANDPELAGYRLQLERELAAEDALFEQYTSETYKRGTQA